MAAFKAPAAVGIDLGTTYSCIGVFQHGQVEIVPVAGNRKTPSCVLFTDRVRLIGEDTKNAIAKNPANAVYQAKSLLGRTFHDPIVQKDMKHWTFKVINGEGRPKIQVDYKGETKCFSPEEILAMILLKLKEGAEDYLGTTVSKVVITVPAFFDDSQRQATKDAATIAGFDVIRVLNESTAAAFAYELTKKIKPKLDRKVLIFDLGGCNVGVSILVIEDGIFEVKSTAGKTHLGGDDFVERMVIQFVNEIKQNSGKDLSNNKQALIQLRTACERMKRVLSSSTEAPLDIDFLSEDIYFHSSMTRSRFEELNADLFHSAIELVDKTIQQAQMKKSEVDEIVIIGGSSRIPKIQKMLREYFGGKELIASMNPDEAVVTGATIQAAILQGEKSKPLSDYLLLDVASHSLGIETAGGVMHFMIKRNTTIPTKQNQTFTYGELGYSKKPNLLVKIFEGESANVKDNYLLGVLELTGIPPAPREDFEVEITFDIDANGVLEVFASDKTTGHEKRMKITNDYGHLSKEEVEQMKILVERYRLNDLSF